MSKKSIQPIKFEIPVHRVVELKKWKKEQDRKVANKQAAKKGITKEWKKFAYYGAIGGAYVYKFVPTGINIVIKVENVVTKEEIDLTDYEDL